MRTRVPARAAAAAVALAMSTILWPSLVAAQPPASFVATFECSDGNSYDINFGAPKNFGSVGFVVGTNTLLVGKTFTATFDGEVIERISWVRGIEGFDEANLLTCVADLGDLSFTLVGWLSPATP